METEAPWPEATQRPPECPGAPSHGDAGSGAGLADEKAEAAAAHRGRPWMLGGRSSFLE